MALASHRSVRSWCLRPLYSTTSPPGLTDLGGTTHVNCILPTATLTAKDCAFVRPSKIKASVRFVGASSVPKCFHMKAASGRKAKSGAWVHRGAGTWILGPPCSGCISAGHYKHCYSPGIITHRASLCSGAPAAHPDGRCRKPFPGMCQCCLVILRAGTPVLAVLTSDCARRLWSSIFGATRTQLRPQPSRWAPLSHQGSGRLISFSACFPTFPMQSMQLMCLGCSCKKPCPGMPTARGGVDDIVPLTGTDLGEAVREYR